MCNILLWRLGWRGISVVEKSNKSCVESILELIATCGYFFLWRKNYSFLGGILVLCKVCIVLIIKLKFLVICDFLNSMLECRKEMNILLRIFFYGK